MIIHADLNKDENFNDEKLCLICYDKYDENHTKKDKMLPVKLKCGHVFHYECIYMTYKSKQTNSKLRQCPLCRKDGGFLPLIPGQGPQKYIHLEYAKLKNNETINIELIPGKCKYILKTGKNAGCQCKFGIKTDEGYCNMHYKKINQE